MTDVFQALYQHWKKVKNPAKKRLLSKILFDSKVYAAEIEQMRRYRAEARQQAELRGDTNGLPTLGELHILEYEACRELCPTLKVGKGSAKSQGWKWVKKQPWAKDLLAPQIEKRFY